MIVDFNKRTGYVGQIDIDIFDVNGEYYFSEVNPRFGGGYPHAYESGVNNIRLMCNNLNGLINDKQLAQYDDGIYMMKYSEIFIKK